MDSRSAYGTILKGRESAMAASEGNRPPQFNTLYHYMLVSILTSENCLKNLHVHQ